MTQACATCRSSAPGESRSKGVALFVGALLSCPCHLPLTIAAIAALGGTAWLVAHSALLYLLFGVTYVSILVLGLRYVMRSRDAEREHERAHANHVAPSVS